MNNKMAGLYIHVPFCLSKCPYCDFYSVKYNEKAAEEYKNAVIRNILHYGGQFDTVYFGGGTPVLLWKEICGIMEHIHAASGAEITVEANPCCVDEEVLSALKRAGVNRISFGVQSLNDNELKGLGRRHNAKEAVNAVECAKSCGFDNISADIMLGTHGQTEDSVINTIKCLSKLPLTHISAYMLKIEENTPFAKKQLKLPDENQVCSLYLKATELLNELGFCQYEISNYAKDGFVCRHNMKYWNCDEYLGIGPAAHSYYKGKRFFVKRDLNSFIASVYQNTETEDEHPGNYQEYAMLRLRLTDGLLLTEYELRGGSASFLKQMISEIPSELICFGDERLSLTTKGFLVSNAVIGKLLGY